eukprot:7382959-Prymnesium_polylepis.1
MDWRRAPVGKYVVVRKAAVHVHDEGVRGPVVDVGGRGGGPRDEDHVPVHDRRAVVGPRKAFGEVAVGAAQPRKECREPRRAARGAVVIGARRGGLVDHDDVAVYGVVAAGGGNVQAAERRCVVLPGPIVHVGGPRGRATPAVFDPDSGAQAGQGSEGEH